MQSAVIRCVTHREHDTSDTRCVASCASQLKGPTNASFSIIRRPYHPALPTVSSTMASGSMRMPLLQPIIDAVSAAHPNKPPTAGEFCIAYLEAQSSRYQHPAPIEKQPPSLVSATVDRLITSLVEDLHPTGENVKVVRETCDKNENVRRHVLSSPKLPYAACRLLAQDRAVDNWILKNEADIRKMNAEEQLNSLVKLSQGDVVWPGSKIVEGERVITRKLPPREVITVLDECRKKTVRLLPDDAAFAAAWKDATGGLLDGMDWSNILVAGGICLGVLTGVVETSSDVDIYVYGLTARQANKKIEQIYETWWRNLGPSGKPFVFRNAKTITFLSRYPERRIQVFTHPLHKFSLSNNSRSSSNYAPPSPMSC